MTGRPAVDPVARFWAKVKKTRTCWLFMGHQQKRMGYVQFRDSPTTTTYAHIFSFRLHKGKVPRGKNVCHTCDVGNCIRPLHLWAGTQKENIADMVAKGRQNYATGPRNGMFGRRSLGFTGRHHSQKSITKMMKTKRQRGLIR